MMVVVVGVMVVSGDEGCCWGDGGDEFVVVKGVGGSGSGNGSVVHW